MNVIRTVIPIVTLALAGSALAYQVTGPVLEVTDSKIVVQKGKEKCEIARTPDTKVTACCAHKCTKIRSRFRSLRLTGARR